MPDVIIHRAKGRLQLRETYIIRNEVFTFMQGSKEDIGSGFPLKHNLF